ncbi:uncharacterized protein LOC143246398 isoform X2 [Tachypleus tridentatus]|uniref:uncharacterized protein LOC143246398 isoform X2 n=1 Tax=Tachypleus tridentatus TaxID=6853 RepID=UPI003FD07FDA
MNNKNSEERSGMPVLVRCGFGFLVFIAELLLFGVFGLCMFWIIHYCGGVAWTQDVSKQLNLHYILMIGGFIFFNGQAILAYRCFACCKKIYTKVIHSTFFVLTISSVTAGLMSSIKAHEDAGDKHFYSLHSWVGLATMGMFALQFMVGFVSFLVFLCCDNATVKFRQRLLPTHITFGLIVFGMAIVTCLTGLMQTARHKLSGEGKSESYEDLTEHALVINVLGVSILALGILIPFLIRNNTFRHYSTLTVS